MRKTLMLAVSLLCLPLAGSAQITYTPPPEPPRWHVVEFQRTAAQMAQLFTTPFPVTVATPGTVRLPRLLVVYKAAGDAYTVPATSDLKLTRADGGNTWCIVETTGLLDQAGAVTAFQLAPSTASGLYVFGATPPVEDSGFYLTVTNANVTPGVASPTVKFRLYFEEYRQTW